MKQDITERVSENPLAYSGNKLHYELTEDEIMAKKALWELSNLNIIWQKTKIYRAV